MLFLKPILEHATSNFNERKQLFYEQFELLLKSTYNNGFMLFEGIFTYKLCPQNFFIGPLQIKNTRNLYKTVRKRPLLTFVALVAKF